MNYLLTTTAIAMLFLAGAAAAQTPTTLPPAATVPPVGTAPGIAAVPEAAIVDKSIAAHIEANAAEITALHEAAENGDATAQYKLGWHYYSGDGVAKDGAEAYKWWQKSAEQNFPAAQNGVGYIYRYGLGGVAKNDEEALKWYRKAADQGYPEAEGNMGRAYYNGLGIAKDPKLAVEWYQKSADHGFPGSQTGLGRAYLDGAGVDKDAIQAYMWFTIAAAKNDPDATKYLADLNKIMNASDVDKARKLAADWKPKSAEGALQPEVPGAPASPASAPLPKPPVGAPSPVKP